MGLDLFQVDAVSKLQKSKIPIMFIHGEKDDFVPTQMLYDMSSKLPEYRREIFIVQGATHTMSNFVDEKNYQKQIFNFLEKYYI